MAESDYSRAVEQDIRTMAGRKLHVISDYTRDDSVSVDWSTSDIKMEIYDRRGGTLLDTLTEASEITVATAKITIIKILTALSLRSYYFQVFDDTNKQGIRFGQLIMI